MKKVIKYENIRIPSDIYEKIKKKIAIIGFDDVSKFVNFVLEDFLRKTSENKSKDVYEEDVKERLRALGYLE